MQDTYSFYELRFGLLALHLAAGSGAGPELERLQVRDLQVLGGDLGEAQDGARAALETPRNAAFPLIRDPKTAKNHGISMVSHRFPMFPPAKQGLRIGL